MYDKNTILYKIKKKNNFHVVWNNFPLFEIFFYDKKN